LPCVETIIFKLSGEGPRARHGAHTVPVPSDSDDFEPVKDAIDEHAMRWADGE